MADSGPDWGGEHDTPNGRPRRAPTLRARARGVAFKSAYVPSQCAPSRPALARARYGGCAAARSATTATSARPSTARTTACSPTRATGRWSRQGRPDQAVDPRPQQRAGAARGRAAATTRPSSASATARAAAAREHALPTRARRAVRPLPRAHGRDAREQHGGFGVPRVPRVPQGGPAARRRRARARRPLCTAETFPQELYQDTCRRRARAAAARRPAARPSSCGSRPGPHERIVVTAPMADATASRAWPAAVARPGHRERVAACAPGAPGVVADQRCSFAASVEHLDALMGGVLGGVGAATTIACATSDHGAMLHDHGKWSKMKPWEPALRVPLVCAGPGLARARVVRFAPVALLDLSVRRAASRIFAVADDAEPPPPARPSSFLPLASPSSSSSQATFLDLAGVPAAAWRTVTARSLRGLLEAPDAARARGPAALNRTEVTSGCRTRRSSASRRARARRASRSASRSWRSPSVYKLVCCKARARAASRPTARAPRSGAGRRRPRSADKEYYAALYDTLADPYDQRDLLASEPRSPSGCAPRCPSRTASRARDSRRRGAAPPARPRAHRSRRARARPGGLGSFSHGCRALLQQQLGFRVPCIVLKTRPALYALAGSAQSNTAAGRPAGGSRLELSSTTRSSAARRASPRAQLRARRRGGRVALGASVAPACAASRLRAAGRARSRRRRASPRRGGAPPRAR